MYVSIRIKGHLDPTWQDWLEGLEIVHEADGTSRLSGSLQDQPALQGVLKKIGHLSLPLLSLESGEGSPGATQPETPNFIAENEVGKGENHESRSH